MKIETIPCPFCGGGECLPRDEESPVHCRRCGAQGPNNVDIVRLMGIGRFVAYVDAWNTRADDHYREHAKRTNAAYEGVRSRGKAALAALEDGQDEGEAPYWHCPHCKNALDALKAGDAWEEDE